MLSALSLRQPNRSHNTLKSYTIALSKRRRSGGPAKPIAERSPQSIALNRPKKSPLSINGKTRVRGLWDQALRRRQFLEGWLGGSGQSLKAEGLPLPLNRFYTAQFDSLVAAGGAGLLKKYKKASPALAVVTEFPEVALLQWKFPKSPDQWWQHLARTFTAADPIGRAVVELYLQDVVEQHCQSPRGVRLASKAFDPVSTAETLYERFYGASAKESALEVLGSTVVHRFDYLGGLGFVLDQIRRPAGSGLVNSNYSHTQTSNLQSQNQNGSFACSTIQLHQSSFLSGLLNK